MADDTKEKVSCKNAIQIMDGDTIIGLYDPVDNITPKRKRGRKPTTKADKNEEGYVKSEIDDDEGQSPQLHPWSCILCQKAFASKSNLQIHMTIHTGQRFACKICSKCFTQKCNLKRHEATHLGTKSFSCVSCGKKFTQKANLQRHFVIHSGKRCFSCEECGKTFIQKCNWKKHLERHTEKMTFPFVECVLDEEEDDEEEN